MTREPNHGADGADRCCGDGERLALEWEESGDSAQAEQQFSGAEREEVVDSGRMEQDWVL
jgi:hypothetical protein